MNLKELIDGDEPIKNLNKQAAEIRAELYKKINPLEQQIYERKKQIAVDSGLAVRTIAEMSKGKDLRFQKHDENGINVYGAKGTNEKYIHCGVCRLYIRNDAIISVEFDDTADRSEGVHEAGTSYNCPVCGIEIDKKIDSSMAVG